MDKDQLRLKVNNLAKDINNKRRELALAVRCEQYEQAALLRDDARRSQQELLQLVNKK
jgi:protein-arginine kinase activator protein McsA